MMRHIDIDLTEDEHDLLTFVLGVGTAFAAAHFGEEIAKAVVKLTNKIYANNPNYTPYDPESFDPSKPMPFSYMKKN
jgi:hypothetical protein